MDRITCCLSKLTFSLLLFYASFLYGDPWGKDADLVYRAKILEKTYQCCETPFMGVFAEKMIGFHQTVITQIDGPRSNYIPSSSQYTLDAMRKYSFFKGFTMGCDRLMRENDEDWVYEKTTDIHGYTLKYDPVK